MRKNVRLCLFFIEIVALFIITYSCTGQLYNFISYPWFSSGILLIILLSLIDQPFFSKDSNIFVNAVTAFIALVVIPESNRDCVYWILFGTVNYLLLSSYLLMWIRKNPLNEEKKIIRFFSRLNRIIGKPQVLFSIFFLWGVIQEFGFSNIKYSAFFFYWAFIILIDTTNVCNYLDDFFNKRKSGNKTKELGTIFGVQGKNIFLVKLFNDKERESVVLFDPVEFNFKKQSYRGIIIENYLLNEEQWVKVLTNKELNESFVSIKQEEKLHEDILYKLELPKNINIPFINTFVGIVSDNSKIDKIYFTYDSNIDIESGYLLEVRIKDKQIIYQVIDGITKQELLEAKNKTGYITGEAIQLGVWDNIKNCFNKFGWVPEINTPVHIIQEYETNTEDETLLKIGDIPNSNLPVNIDINKAISHHLAVLGVTGTGKSVFVRFLIDEYIKKEKRKVFIFDFTGEHKQKIKNFTPFIKKEDEDSIYESFEKINTEMDKFANQRNQETLTKNKKNVETIIQNNILSFLHSNEDKISIVELPDAENTQNVFDYIRVFFKILFKIAKKDLNNPNFPQVCIVLEEAHTIIPEWNTSSEMNNKASQSALNAISQIALQGRKYNVGLLVIAQRTANVSKTVLTQCNSIISFQVYDKTSMDFLSNYYGETIASVLPTLKTRQAIAAGKAFTSTVPMIFSVPYLEN